MSATERPTGVRGAPELRIRLSLPTDQPALARLAELDSAPPPVGDYLLAEEAGGLRAALPLDGGGPPLADPFHRTAELLMLLELRALGLGLVSVGGARLPLHRAAGAPLRRPLLAAEPALTARGAHS